MGTYRDNYRKLPDTEELEITMNNSSARLDYDRVMARIDADEEYLGERAKEIVARATQPCA